MEKHNRTKKETTILVSKIIVSIREQWNKYTSEHPRTELRDKIQEAVPNITIINLNKKVGEQFATKLNALIVSACADNNISEKHIRTVGGWLKL